MNRSREVPSFLSSYVDRKEGTSLLRFMVRRTSSPVSQRSLARLHPRNPSPPVIKIMFGSQEKAFSGQPSAVSKRTSLKADGRGLCVAPGRLQTIGKLVSRET